MAPGYLAATADSGDGDAAELLADLLVGLTVVWRCYGLGRLVSTSMSLGLEHPDRGPIVVQEVLEPLLEAV